MTLVKTIYCIISTNHWNINVIRYMTYVFVTFLYLILKSSLICLELSHTDLGFLFVCLLFVSFTSTSASSVCSSLFLFGILFHLHWQWVEWTKYNCLSSILNLYFFLQTSASCHSITIKWFPLLPILTIENMTTIRSQVHVLIVQPPRRDWINSWPQSQICKHINLWTIQLFHE